MDTSPSAVQTWGQIIAQLGVAGGALYWLGRYLVPRLIDAQAAALTAFREELKAEREAHAAALAAAREQHAELVQRTHERIDNLAGEVRALNDRVAQTAA